MQTKISAILIAALLGLGAARIGKLSNPVELNSLLQAVTKSVTVDEDFDLVNVALELRNLRSDDLNFLGSPSAGNSGQSVVLPDTARARALYQAVADNSVQEFLKGTTRSSAHATNPSPLATRSTAPLPPRLTAAEGRAASDLLVPADALGATEGPLLHSFGGSAWQSLR